MANLIFYYGTMGSGKTTKLLQDHYNYRKDGHKIVLMKPLLDTKGDDRVLNRMNQSLRADLLIAPNERIISDANLELLLDAKALLVDEAQFLNFDQVKELWLIAHVLNKSVSCYGLKSDFLGKPFEGTQALLGYADRKNELLVNCSCGEVANFNARMVNGEFVMQGDVVAIDGKDNVSYIPLCSECYLNKVVQKNNDDVKLLKRVIRK